MTLLIIGDVFFSRSTAMGIHVFILVHNSATVCFVLEIFVFLLFHVDFFSIIYKYKCNLIDLLVFIRI